MLSKTWLMTAKMKLLSAFMLSSFAVGEVLPADLILICLGLLPYVLGSLPYVIHFFASIRAATWGNSPMFLSSQKA